MELNLSDRHIMAVNVLLFAVLAYFATLAVNDVIVLRRGPAEAPAPRVGRKIVLDSSGNLPRAAYQAIVERDIFNLVPPPAQTPQVVVEDLHLMLIGVSQTTKGKPFAIVEDQTGQQSVYRVGETIPGSGKLLEVTKNSAIVEHAGKHVAIELPKDEMNSGDEDAGPSPAEASSLDAQRHRFMRRNRFH